MASRMDRHNTTNTVSRSKLNQELYDSIGKNEKEIDYSYINVIVWYFILYNIFIKFLINKMNYL